MTCLKRPAAKSHSLSKSTYALYMLVPALIVYSVLFVLPSVAGLVLSFFNMKTLRLSAMTFAGIRNYINVLADPYINIAIKNTVLFAAVTTVGKVGLGMALALFVNKKFHGSQYMRTVFFLPAVLNNVAVGLVFRAMMHPSTGILNKGLTAFGLAGLTQNWLTDTRIAIFSCAFVEIWKWTGYTMVILLAGLQSIDTTYYEAAGLDGASPLQKFRYVTLPLMMPAFNNALIINMIGGLKVFDIVQTLTKGGPGSATSVFGTVIYSSFSNGSYGKGCAASIILTLCVLIIVLPTYRFIAKKEVEA